MARRSSIRPSRRAAARQLTFARDALAMELTPRIKAMADMALEAARMLRAGAAEAVVEAFCTTRVAAMPAA